MQHIIINKKEIFQGRLHSSSTESNAALSAANLLKDNAYWSTLKRSEPAQDFVIVDYEKEIAADFIEMLYAPAGAEMFPASFRFEFSSDLNSWGILHSETFSSSDEKTWKINVPLTAFRYLKLVITEHSSAGYSEIGVLRVGIRGTANASASSTADAAHSITKLFDGDDKTFWLSNPAGAAKPEHIMIDLGSICPIDRLVLCAAKEGFPLNFRIDVSIDKELWTPACDVKKFYSEPYEKYFWNIPTMLARYIRLQAHGVLLSDGKFGLCIAGLYVCSSIHEAGFQPQTLPPYASAFQAGLVKFAPDGGDEIGTAVQAGDSRLRDATTLFKGIMQFAENDSTDSGLAVQASDPRLKPATELHNGTVRLAGDRMVQSGAVVQSTDSRLTEATIEHTGIVRLCEDGVYSEQSVVTGNDSRLHKATTSRAGIMRFADDKETEYNTAVQGSDSRLKDATTVSKGIVELAEDGEDKVGVAVQGNDRRLKDATTAAKGIVELAEDGEDKAGVAVQGNDRRLKEGSEVRVGIVRFAKSGEEAAGAAVQGNDPRLKDATRTSKGIVRLAADGEDNGFTAVQGNDRRLKDATTTAKGIVELAEDGEDKAGVAVQGNDSRLKPADEASPGIMRFAGDGETLGNAAVQGNDSRLKTATVSAKGIVRLAADGEDNGSTAVQGSDRRLKDATTVSKGIVELAEDGEDKAGVAVQGNDCRLKTATEDTLGIVRLAGSGETRPEFVVQANDPRLTDAREPLPHEHNYAPVSHSFAGHTGTISISEAKNSTFNGITPPNDGSAVIFGSNLSNTGGSIGVAGVSGTLKKGKILSYGVVGHSGHVGVRGQSAGDADKGSGSGVMGLSRFGAGGVFASEHGYAVVADGFGDITKYDTSVILKGEGKGLYVNGTAEFNGKISIVPNELPVKAQSEDEETKPQFPGNIVEMFKADEAEYITAGDMLTVSKDGGSVLSRVRKAYDTGVIGVVAGNPVFILNNSGEKEKLYPIALAGKVLCRIDARNNPVKPGDLIVASDTAGCGMGGAIDSFDKVGAVIGKALDGLKDGIALVPVFITHK